MSRREFKREYNLEKLKTVRPQNRDFEMVVNPGHYDFYLRNAYEDYTADLLLNLFKDGSLFIDIGAHFGFYALSIGTRNKTSKIIAFEPVPENCAILRKSLELNKLHNVELNDLAISDKNETRRFNVTTRSSEGGFYQPHLSTIIKTIEVRAVTLDSFLQSVPQVPTVVKIDTEGHELHVLEGMRNILEKAGDIRLFVEFNPSCLKSAGFQPEDLLNKISQFGFDMYFIDDEQRELYKLAESGLKNWNTYFGEGNFKKDYFNILCIKKEKSLSVCFFSHSSQLLGAERCLLGLTTELIRDRGIICSVVLPSEGPLKDKLDEVAVSTSVVDYSWWCQPIRPSDKQISAQFSRSLKNVINHTRHELSKINPDIVCSNTMVIPWGAIAASSLDKPHVWFIHEFGILDHGFEFYLPFKRVLEIIRNSSNMIVTNSNAVREGLWGGTSAGNIVTVYPFTDIRHDATSQDIGVSFRRPGATKLVITGLITESKGQRDAVLAVKELIRRKRDVELIIMGPSIPSYLTELKRTVKDEALDEYVKFVDFKENPYPIVSQADIAVVCSRSEAFGLVTLEAMLLKKPVVGTNSGATPELIKEGFNGLLYESGHHDQLADKIEYLMQHNDKIEEFGENGYKLANASFTRAEYVRKVHEMLRDLRNKENPSTTPYSQFLTELFDDVQKRHCDIITRLTKGYQKVVDKVLPPGTRRRNLYVLGSSGIKVISSEGVVPFCVKTSRYIGRYVMSHDPRNPAGKA